MENAIVVLVLIVIAAGIGWYLVRAKKRGETCIGCPSAKQCVGHCGCENENHLSQKPADVLCEKTFKVDGMHCEHCKGRVEQAVNDIQGVSGKVDLKKGELAVRYTAEVADDVIKSAIANAGFTVVE